MLRKTAITTPTKKEKTKKTKKQNKKTESPPIPYYHRRYYVKILNKRQNFYDSDEIEIRLSFYRSFSRFRNIYWWSFHSGFYQSDYHPYQKTKQNKKKQKNKTKKLSYPPSHTIIEDTIRHDIAQMTSTSKAYISCLLATIIKWCHIIV